MHYHRRALPYTKPLWRFAQCTRECGGNALHTKMTSSHPLCDCWERRGAAGTLNPKQGGEGPQQSPRCQIITLNPIPEYCLHCIHTRRGMVRRRKTIVAVTIGAAGELGRATVYIITAPPTRRTEGPKRDGEHQAEAQFHAFRHGSALIYPPLRRFIVLSSNNRKPT